MSRYFYSDYAAHALKFYSKYPTMRDFKTDIDRTNWTCAKATLDELHPQDRETVMDIFSRLGNIVIIVNDVCSERNLDKQRVWVLKDKVLWSFAQKRGLIP